jgi:hypothetical protein
LRPSIESKFAELIHLNLDANSSHRGDRDRPGLDDQFHFMPALCTIPAMTHRLPVVLTMVAGLLLAGCQLDTTPQDVANYASNREAVKDTADYNGTFVLYRDDQPDKELPAITSTHLGKGAIYGFEVDAQQTPYAVAGQQRVQLTPGRYRWEMRPDAGQIDWNKTNAVVVTVVVFTVAVAGLVVIALVIQKHL